MTGVSEYMRWLVAGGPTRSGHRTPTVVVEAPVNGTDAANVRFNAWQFRQILGRGVHGILLCQAESADAVCAFVESCRYPHHSGGVDPSLPSPIERMHGVTREQTSGGLGVGTRGRGSEMTASGVWGSSPEEYMACCDPWPLNPRGELLLGVKLESHEGIAHCEEIVAVPGLGFAEMGPGDLGLALGYVAVPRDPYPPEMREARERVFAACRKYRVAFLEAAAPENIAGKLDEGVRVIAGHHKETAIVDRAHQTRTMPV